MALSDHEILNRFEHVRKLSDGTRGQARWDAFCPAHDTHHHSLAIAKFEDGGWMVKCYAGCEQGEILTAVGLRVRDLCPGDSIANGTRIGHNKKHSRGWCEMVLTLAEHDRRAGKRLSRRDKDTELEAWVGLRNYT